MSNVHTPRRRHAPAGLTRSTRFTDDTAIVSHSRARKSGCHSCANAQPPTISAGPVLRAGFTEVLVTGMLIR